jgi:hypothetical protein
MDLAATKLQASVLTGWGSSFVVQIKSTKEVN